MKKILLVAAMATFSLGAFAQSETKVKDEPVRGPFLTNKTFDNVFISVGGGANLYFGENDKDGDKQFAPALDISLGKWFTPVVGARFQYSGLSAKGWAANQSAMFVDGAADGGLFPEKFDLSFYHADFLFNLSNAVGGYRQTRFWEFVPFVGFGGATASNDDNKDRELALTAGLINKFRLCDALDLNLELKGMLTNQRLDGVVGGKKCEGMATASLGLSYKFKKRGFEKSQAVAADYSSYKSRILALEGDLNNAKSRADQLAKELADALNRTPTNTATTEYVLPQSAVFFPIGEATITDKEKINIGYMADAIKKMAPGKKIKLVGNADSTTGSKQINQKLSEARAKAVYDALVAAGVKASLLEIVANGDTKEPFEHNKPALNRVLLMTAE